MPSPEVKKIGKYEIQAELGQGGFGRVYRAFDPTVGRPVALKILMTEGNKDLLTRFRNEATSAGNLRHRNIVTIYDFGEFSGRPYLVMELLEGEDLTQTISSARPLTLLQKMNIMDQVADGLDCAHSNGVVHRDVKPANIRLLPDGTVKILDFGIARVSREKGTRLTQQGDLIGTILYVSPEQFGGADADALCDIFAYGVTYYEFLTGKHPFGSSDPRSVMFKITMEDPPPLRSLLPECPEFLEQILNRALQKDRELRYQSLRDLRLDTEPLIIELKQARAKELITEAQQLPDDDPQRTLELINEAVNLDPANREARQLRESVQRTLQKKALQPRVDSMLQTAEEQLAKGSVSQAVLTLESAQKLDQTDVRIRSLLEGARERLKILKDAARLANAALGHMNRGEWQAAFEKGSEAARLDGSNREAARVVEAVQKYERELDVRVGSQIAAGDLDSALSALHDLASLHPESTGIQSRIAETAANKAERDRVKAVVGQAEQLVREAKFGEAVELLASSKLPQEAGVAALRRRAEEGLAARRRAEAIAKITQSAGALLSASRVDEALQEIESSLGLYPDEKSLLQLRKAAEDAKAARDRARLLQKVTAECERLGAENRLAEAVKMVEDALGQYPSETALRALLDRVTTQRKLQERAEAVGQAVQDARQRLTKHDFAGASGVLESALMAYPDDATLIEARKQSLEARAKHERRLAVEEAAQQCERLIQLAKFADAMKAVEASLRQFPGEPLLVEKQRRAQEGQNGVRESLSRAAGLEQKSDFAAALSEVDAGLARYPGETSLTEKRAALAAAQSAFERKTREAAIQAAHDFAQRAHGNVRDEDIDKMLEEAKALAYQHSKDQELRRAVVDAGQQLLDLRQARAKAAAGDLEGARAAADTYLKRFPQHAGFLALQQQIGERERQIALDYRAEVEKALGEEPSVDRRVLALQEAGRRYPQESFYPQELDRLKAARAVAEEATSLEKSGRSGDAAEAWKRLASTYPSYPGLQAQIERTTKLNELARSEAENNLSAQIQKALDEGNYSQAVALSTKAEADFPGKFQQIALQAKQSAERRSQAERLLASAQELAGKNQWEAAQRKLNEAMDAAPGDRNVTKDALEAHTKYARSAAGAGNWKAAEALLQQPGVKAPADLVASIADCKRVGFVEKALTESEGLRQSGKLQDALNAVMKGLQAYPGEAKLQELKSKIESTVGEAARLEGKKKALEELRQLEAEAGAAGSLDPLERVMERAQFLAQAYPKDADFASAVSSIRQLVEPLRRGRKFLDEGKLDEAEKLAGETLDRFPNHPAFAALAAAVRDVRAQAAKTYRDETARKLKEEQNPEKREAILVEALRRYPGEANFKQELDALRERGRQIAKALGDAKSAEQGKRYEEARGHWEKLRAIDAGYPGIDAEIQRLTALMASAQAGALDAALAEVRGAIDQGSLERANGLLSAAETEFRAFASSERAALRARLDDLILATRQAEEGRGLFAKRDYAGGAAKFLAAARKVPKEFRIVDGFLGELKQQAEAVIDSDWRSAEAILQAISSLKPDHLKPDHAVLPALQARVEQHRSEELVTGVLNESQRQWDSGDLRGAEKSAQSGLQSYPGEARLTQRVTAIRSALEEEGRRQRREAAITELAAVAKEAETANLKRLRQAGKKIDAALARAASDPEAEARAAEVRKMVADRIAALEEPPRQAVAPVSAPMEPVRAIPEPISVAAEPIAAPPVGVEKRRWNITAIAAAAVVVIGGAVMFTRLTNSDHRVPVSITSETAGASVSIGNESCVTPGCALKLAPGAYTLTAKKDGYKTITQPVRIAAKQAELHLPLAFEPLPQMLQVNTNFESGRVFLDGHAAGNLRDGQFTVSEELPPGEHTIRVTGGGADFQTKWRSAVGVRPELVGPMEAKDVQATVIANAGNSAAIACNCGTQNVTVDGAPAGQTPAADGTSAPLQNLKEGSRTLSIAGHNLIFKVQPNPTLSVFLALDRNVGTIVVEAAEDNARVYLNNRLYRRVTLNGSVRIPVDVGEYSVRVEKDGFRGAAAQNVSVKKGDEARVITPLTPIPPVMEIVAAIPGAQVKVDGNVVGEVAANGALRAEVAAGEHAIEVTKDDYTPAHATAQFSPGKTTRLDQGQLAMARVVKTPPPPDPKQIDAQDWDRVRNSNSPDSLDDYVRRHPDGAHLDEARAAAARLRQETLASAARQAEQSAWDATDKSNKTALQNFISRFGNGAHAQEAHGLVAGIEKREADELAAARRAKELRTKEQDQAKQAAGEQQAVRQVVVAYAEAYNRMDLRALQGIWSSMPKAVADGTRNQFRDARSLAYEMTPAGPAAISGDTATIACTRILRLVTKSGDRLPPINERVRVTLKRAASGWAINSIDAN